MRYVIIVSGILLAVATSGQRAQAQNYPWCAYYSGLGGTNCGFTTYAQCMATLQGMGGFCQRNTQYRSGGAPAQPSPWPYGR